MKQYSILNTHKGTIWINFQFSSAKRRSLFALFLLLTAHVLLPTTHYSQPTTAHAAVVPSMPSNQGLVGHWKFDEGRTNMTRDYSGNGNTGTLTNFADPATATSGWTTSGKINTGIMFDGSNDYVSVPDSTSTNISTGEITLSAWIKPTVVGDGLYHSIISKRGSSLNTNYELDLQVTSGALMYFDGVVRNSTYVPAANVWTHVAATVVGTTLTLYANGIAVYTNPSVNPLVAATTSNPMSIGRVGYAVIQQFQGGIDDVRIYNRALSASEVAGLARGSAVSKPVSPVGTSLSTGLVGHWTFNGKDVAWGGTTGTTTIRDVSGNGFHGGIYGKPASALIQGKEGQALTFGGYLTRGVYLGTDPNLNPSIFTISGWIRTSSSTYAYNYIYSNSRDCCGSPYYGIDLAVFSTGRLTGAIWDGAAKSTIQSAASAILPNQWTHVAFSFDGTNMRLYKNGILIGTSATTTNGVGSPASFAAYLGSMGSGNGQTYTLGGQLDDMYLHSRALSDAEILSLYRLSSGTKTSVSSSVLDPSSGSGVNSGLIGHWTFDGSKLTTTTATDSSGRGNTGALTGSPTAVIGKIGQALQFNGTTTRVTVTNSAVLQINSGTLSAWIKTPDAGSGYRGIITKSSAYGIYLRDNIFVFYDPTTGLSRTTGVNLANNKWHHVVATFDSGVAGGTSLYINGVLRATTTITISSQASNVSIGVGQGGSGQTFSGSIDDPRIYNRILSASEIYNLYRSGTR